MPEILTPEFPIMWANRFLFPRQAIWVGSYHLQPKGLTGSLRPPKEKGMLRDLPAGPVAKNAPAKAGDTSPTPGQDGWIVIHYYTSSD